MSAELDAEIVERLAKLEADQAAFRSAILQALALVSRGALANWKSALRVLERWARPETAVTRAELPPPPHASRRA